MGTLGRACVVPDKVPRMISTKHVWTISLDLAKTEPRWISFWINYSRFVREELLAEGTGTAIPGLNGEKLRSLSLPQMSLSEQRRIVAYLDELQAKVDEIREVQAETSAELDALMPSILDKAFRGELLPAEQEIAQATEA
jgi:type I restriction enzyme, S subunit